MEPATQAVPAEPKAAPVEAPKQAPVAAVPDAPPKDDAAPKETRTYTQEELDRITAKVKKNERYRTRKEVEAFYQGRESAAPKPDAAPQAPKPAEDKPPTRDQYESYEAFLDAKAEYTGRKAAAEYRQKAEAEARAERDRTAAAERAKSFQEKVNAKYPDLPERIADIGEIVMPEGMSDAIAESDLGPDVLNHFADNPKDFERIAALKPSAAIREIGKLEARLEAAQKHAAPPVAEVKKPSAAPAPIAPVGGNAAAGGDDLASLVDNPQKWREARERQLAKRRAGSAK